jgi:uncharacterized membrane protein
MVNIYGISKLHVKVFTDAVFGVAITILAVELQVPNIDSGSLIDSREFEELVTTFVSYITTFIIMGIYWITYHSIFNPIRRTTDLLIWLNLLFLLFIAIIPFSIRLIDKYDNQNSFIFYSLIQILTGLMLLFMWRHAIRKQLLHGKDKNGYNTLSPVVIRLTYIRTIIVPIVFVISITLSFNHPDLASIFPLIIIPISLLVRWRYKHHKELYAEEA